MSRFARARSCAAGMTSLSATDHASFSARVSVRVRGWIENAPGRAFWLFFSASLFFSFGFSIFFFLFNLYLLNFGYTERSLGIIGGLAAGGGIVGTIPAGMLAQRFGLRRTLMCSMVCCVIFTVLRSCIVWQPMQLGLAFLSGMTI